MLRQTINEQMIGAMKAQEKVKLETLRYLWSLIKNAEIDAKKELEDGEIMKIIGTEVKRRKEAIGQIRGGGREEMAVAEEGKLKFLQEFLPEQISEIEIETEIEKVMAEGKKEFGEVMGEVMKRVAGKADGKMVSELVRKRVVGNG